MVFFFREKVEKLNFSSSFMSKDLHSQEAGQSPKSGQTFVTKIYVVFSAGMYR